MSANLTSLTELAPGFEDGLDQLGKLDGSPDGESAGITIKGHVVELAQVNLQPALQIGKVVRHTVTTASGEK